MKFLSLNGKLKTLRSPSKYLIDWNKQSRSKFQMEAKKFLNQYWLMDIVFEEFPVVGTKLTLDFYNATRRVAVEIQGAQHQRYNRFMHGGSKINFLDQLERDAKKLEFCEKNDILLVEIYPEDKICEETFAKFGENIL
jgi:hypothetical protein